MIILLLIFMTAAILLFIARAKNPSAYWMASVLLGWFLSMAGLVLFIAKYGGFYYKVNLVLFFNDTIRNWLLLSPFSIEAISRMITIGRSVFIFSLIGLSISLFYYRAIKETWKFYTLNAILPLLNVWFYDPVVYKRLLGVLDHNLTYSIGWLTRLWLIVSTVIALFLMIRRYRRITIPWFKKQNRYILLGIFSLVLFYFYLGFMGPLQVSDVRTYYILFSDFSNFNPPLSLFEWYVSIAVTGILSIVGIISIWNYTEVEKKVGKADLQLERKLKIANMGARVFTHAIKNQLLVIQLLLNQTRELVYTPEGASENKKVGQNLDKVTDVVNQTIKRLDQLYNSFKSSHLHLKPIDINRLVRKTIERIGIIPDYIKIYEELLNDEVMVLADQTHLSEAIYNIIINAVEAIGKEKQGIIRIVSYIEEHWFVVKIVDNGSGIPEDQLESIFDPFYTNKNTNRNWGVGLSYSKHVVNSHFGHIHVESNLNVGSSFSILLPVYILDNPKES